MGLALYSDNDPTAAYGSNPLRTVHDGRLGGAHEVLIYIRNDDATKYYTGITVGYAADAGIDAGPLGNTGWSIKFCYGQRQPTEAEWDRVTPGASINLPDIGAAGSADTSTYHPVWVRVYCPGETSAQLRVGQRIEVNYVEDMV